jgi:hypothetical protein
MKKTFKEKLQEKVDTFNLMDLYETKFFPSRLWRTDKDKPKIAVFSSQKSYEKYQKDFQLMLKERFEVLILEMADKIREKK